MKKKNLTDQELLNRLIECKSVTAYWNIVSELRTRSNDFVFNTCCDLIASEIPKKRIAGIDVLAQLGINENLYRKQAVDFLIIELSKEKSSKVLYSILCAVSHNNDKLNQKQIEKIMPFKYHKSVNVRYGVVVSLLGLENTLAIDTLISLSSDKKSHIRNWATFGLGTQIDVDNDNIRNTLWNRVDDSDQDTKYEAIVGLSKRKDVRIKEVIERELVKGEFGTLLFEAIEILDAKEFVPLLRTNLENCRIENGIDPSWIADLEGLIAELEKE